MRCRHSFGLRQGHVVAIRDASSDTFSRLDQLLLTSAKIEYFSAAFYLRNPPSDGLPHDTLSISRRRFVGEGMQERLVVRNESAKPVRFELGLEVGCDFADIMSVKEHDFALGNPELAKPLPPDELKLMLAERKQMAAEAELGQGLDHFIGQAEVEHWVEHRAGCAVRDGAAIGQATPSTVPPPRSPC